MRLLLGLMETFRSVEETKFFNLQLLLNVTQRKPFPLVQLRRRPHDTSCSSSAGVLWERRSRPGRRLNNELLLFSDPYDNKAFSGISLLASGKNLQIHHEEKYKSDI